MEHIFSAKAENLRKHSTFYTASIFPLKMAKSEKSITIKLTKLSETAKIPSYAHEGDAGLDLFSNERVVLKPLATCAVKTGIKIELPKGFAALVWDKSGLALNGIKTIGGVVDSGYRGEVKVAVINLSNKTVYIEKGQKIAQMLIQKVENAKIAFSNKLSLTSRGENGFGSTGFN